MRRVSTLLLEVALLLSAVAALFYLVRMILAPFMRHDWFWGGAVASVAGPVLIAAALRLLGEDPARALLRDGEIPR
ncbi:hypothetical protein SAMN06297144_2938 [Sphingomonas guangdongensis]|uniref:Uncharacterized protein n=1 Tax=Sphingomonas guangdongensis TaxID=1141890 RepID=A0A285R135_9SPHN|nr:hypothetical protein [Sphingomonas guangdongensis]SOB87801.1 hypothetical protein SAMN06297144_2938 [Sphingomonas guangdongensis]